jgi:23S rRNA (uridine2552-2'-O)-methyltransferase
MPQPRKLHDHFFQKAKAEGYLARSAYKLKEIVQRRRSIAKGDRVLDLGCAPGSWLQVAGEIVGPKGLVVGLDLQAIDAPAGSFAPNVHAFQGDVFKTSAEELLTMAGASSPTSRFDAVISDMAPNTTGAGDHFRSVDLCRRVLDLLPRLLRPGGNLVMKVFEGETYPELLRDVKSLFAETKGLKPEACRDVSCEIYIVASGYKAPVATETPR